MCNNEHLKGRYLSVFIVLFNRFSRIFPRDAIKRLIIKFKRIIIKIKIIMILKLNSDRLLGHKLFRCFLIEAYL